MRKLVCKLTIPNYRSVKSYFATIAISFFISLSIGPVTQTMTKLIRSTQRYQMTHSTTQEQVTTISTDASLFSRDASRFSQRHSPLQKREGTGASFLY